MQRSLQIMLALGAAAVLAGALVMWRGTPEPTPPVDSGMTRTPAKTVGTSALSHGGPASVRKTAESQDCGSQMKSPPKSRLDPERASTPIMSDCADDREGRGR